MEEKTLTLSYTLDGDKAKFDFYMFPVELAPQLVKQLNEMLWRGNAANSEHFNLARAQFAHNIGSTPEIELARNLKLKPPLELF